MTDDQGRELITVAEAAKVLGTSKQNVYRRKGVPAPAHERCPCCGTEVRLWLREELEAFARAAL